MDKIILHRGNTKNAAENSLESLDISEVWEELLKINNSIMCNNSTGIQIVIEIDVVAKSPFIIFHNVDDKIGDHFQINDIQLADKHICDLTSEDIEKLPKVNKNNVPHTVITLTTLLKHASKNNQPLYLDIKICDNTSDLDLVELFHIVEKYSIYNPNIIDSILSFDPMIEKRIFEQFSNDKSRNGIMAGCFIHHCPDIPDSYQHMISKIKTYLPSLVSADYHLLEDVRYSDMVMKHKNKYMWTLHKSDLANHVILKLIIEHGIIPVIDMFDIS